MCLVSEWSPFSEGYLLGPQCSHVSDQQLLGSLAGGGERNLFYVFVCACVPVGWTGELALGIYFHVCLECGQLWVGLCSPTVPRSRIINQTS